MESQSRAVLLIDDAPEFAELVAAVFSEAGLRLATVTNLPAAVRVLSDTSSLSLTP
jgi:CheY-like chemotaxis protein